MANRVPLSYNPSTYMPENLSAGDNIDLQSTGKVVNLAAATAAGDALSWGQSGGSLAGLSLTALLSMGGNAITGLPSPVSGDQAANKSYVDAALSGVVNGTSWIAPVVAVATSNVASLSGLQTLDGISLSAGQRVGLPLQATGSQNGVWVVQSGAWTRPLDFSPGKDASSVTFWCEKGTQNADSQWYCTNDTTAAVDTASLTFQKILSSVGYGSGAGLTLASSVFSIKAGDGIDIASNSAATNVKIDASGGLQFTGTAGAGALALKPQSNGGLSVSATGVSVAVDGATISTSSGQLKVLGLPASFTLGGAAVSGNVTATTLSSVAGGTQSNADSAHVHMMMRGQFTTSAALTKADPVYWSASADTLDRCIGTASGKNLPDGVALSSVGQSGQADVVFEGVAPGVLSGATPGALYYLASSGGLSTSPPTVSGSRIFVVGRAKNATDLYLLKRDYGTRMV